MKSHREHVSSRKNFPSIRRLPVGVVSLAHRWIGYCYSLYGAEVKADEATTPATEASNHYRDNNK